MHVILTLWDPRTASVVSIHAMQAYKRIIGVDQRVSNLGAGCRWVTNFTPWPFYPLFVLRRKLGKCQSWSGLLEKGKISCPCLDLNLGLSSPYPSHPISVIYINCSGNDLSVISMTSEFWCVRIDCGLWFAVIRELIMYFFWEHSHFLKGFL